MLTETQKELRQGMFTGSEIWKLMGAKGLGDTGMTYIMDKVAEHFGVQEPEMTSRAIEWGNENEPEAARYYEIADKCKLEPSGFIIAPWSDHAGASPDRKIEGKNSGIEIKCPYNPKNHIKHLLIRSTQELKEASKEYYWQVQMELAVTGWDYIDFVSFDPRFKGNLRMWAVKIAPVEADIILMKARISEAVKIKDQTIKQILS